MALDPRRPAGTIEELEKLNINLRIQSSCAQPDKGRGIRGCINWEECPFKQLKGKAGPELIGYRLYKPGGLTREQAALCYDMIDATNMYNKNEGYIADVLWIGGGEINVRGTRPHPTDLTQLEAYNEKKVFGPAPRVGEREDTILEQEAKRIWEDRKSRIMNAQRDASLTGSSTQDAAKQALMDTIEPE